MIAGIGCDICNIERIEKVWRHFGERFVNRTCSVAEQAELIGTKNFEQYIAGLAKFFAAKEAFVKAIGTGFRYGIKFTEIEVLPDELGKPEIKVSGVAAEFVEKLEVKNMLISLSDDYPYVQAMVVLEK